MVVHQLASLISFAEHREELDDVCILKTVFLVGSIEAEHDCTSRIVTRIYFFELGSGIGDVRSDFGIVAG